MSYHSCLMKSFWSRANDELITESVDTMDECQRVCRWFTKSQIKMCKTNCGIHAHRCKSFTDQWTGWLQCDALRTVTGFEKLSGSSHWGTWNHQKYQLQFSRIFVNNPFQALYYFPVIFKRLYEMFTLSSFSPDRVCRGRCSTSAAITMSSEAES